MSAQTNLITQALRTRYPTICARMTDEWRWSVISAILIFGLPLAEKYWNIPIHKTAVAFAGGIIALLAFALTAASTSIPNLLAGNFGRAKDPANSLLKVVGIVWLNIAWLFWITIATFILSILSQYHKIAWIGAAVPGLGLLAIIRTYLATRESFRTFVALIYDRFDRR